MSLLKQRQELKKKLEGKLTEEAPIKKEAKRVSKLVIPQKFAFSTFNVNINNNSEEKQKSLNTSLSKSTGNLSASNSPRKLSSSLFKSNSIQIEDKPEVLSRVSSERKLSSKSFSIHSPTENISFDELNSRPKSFVEDSSRSSNTLSVFSDSSSHANAAAAVDDADEDSADIPIIVGSIRKNSLPDNSSTIDELKEIVNFVRSPKPSKKEETSTILHFNFAAKPDAITKQRNLHKIPSLKRSGSRHAILVPEEDNVDGVIHISKEDLENVDIATKHTPKEENVKKEKTEKYDSNIENILADFTNTNMKKSDENEDEIYVNIDIIRRYYDSATRIKSAPIKKNPVPSIRYSLIRKLTKCI